MSSAATADLVVSSGRMGAQLRPDAVIAGRYRLDRPLGRGGMGAVWAATHTVTRRRVAMKFVRGPAHARSELRGRFLREARAATAVKHPNVVHVIDVFELDEDTPVMVMELLEGETLAARIEREERLSLTETARILLPVISAVGTAHARGIVHRDLKPENIFLAVDRDGHANVKVLDFGIAKLVDADGLEAGGLVTQTGATLGTPCYMAPEQAVATKDPDHRVDVWALGVILYECLSGVRPIEGESVGQVVMRLMSTGITPLERLVRGLPEDVTTLVARMLARERDKRPEDLREVARTLRKAAPTDTPAFAASNSDGDNELEQRDERLAPGVAAARKPAARKAPLLLATAVIVLGVGAWALRTPGRALTPSAPTRRNETPPSRPSADTLAPPASQAPANHRTASNPTPPPAHSAATRRAVRKVDRVSRHAPGATPSATATATSSVPLVGLAETPPF